MRDQLEKLLSRWRQHTKRRPGGADVLSEACQDARIRAYKEVVDDLEALLAQNPLEDLREN